MTPAEQLDEFEMAANKYVEALVRVLNQYGNLSTAEKAHFNGVCTNLTAKVVDAFGASRTDLEMGSKIMFDKVYDKNR